MGSTVTGNGNIAIGETAQGAGTVSGTYNIAMGTQSQAFLSSGQQNVSIGNAAGAFISSGDFNITIGGSAGGAVSTGTGNVIIGRSAGAEMTGASGSCVLIGTYAGRYLNADGCVIIGNNAGPAYAYAGSPIFDVVPDTQDNQLFIDNTATNTPLIYGRFDLDEVTINGDLEVTGAVTGFKPQTEQITITGSPPSDVINTTVSTVATTGGYAGLQVFRNGVLQREDLDGASPIAGDFIVTGANQLTFAPGVLQNGDEIIIFVFT